MERLTSYIIGVRNAMDKRSVSRRNILAATIAVVPCYALSSTADAVGIKNGSAAARYGGLRSLSKPRGVTLQIESLDTRLSFNSSFDTVNVPFHEVHGFQQHTAIPAPYYFDVDIDEKSAPSGELGYTVNLYDAAGNDIGSITVSEGGTATFLDQQVMFRVYANFD